MAVPGEPSCHPVLPCGAAKYPDIPPDWSTNKGVFWVDAAYGGNDSDGSMDKPWASISAAVKVAKAGAVILVTDGKYGPVLIEKPLQIAGRCPDKVTIGGSGALASVDVREGADGTRIRGITAADAVDGFIVWGAKDVVVDACRVNGNLTGIEVSSLSGPTEVTVRDSLLEAADEQAALVEGAILHVERTTIREAHADGIMMRSEDQRASVTVAGSVIEGCIGAGIADEGSDLTVQDTVIRDTVPDPGQAAGAGFAVLALGDHPTVGLEGCVVERNWTSGIYVEGGDLTLTTSVVRETRATEGLTTSGRGVETSVQAAVFRPEVTITSSVVEDNPQIGVIATGVDLHVTSTRVRRNGHGGIASGAPAAPSQIRAEAHVEASVIEDNQFVGLWLLQSFGSLRSSVVRGTIAGGVTDQQPRAVDAVGRAVPGEVALEMHRVAIEDNHSAGVVLHGAVAHMDEVLVKNIIPDAGWESAGIAAQNEKELPSGLELAFSELSSAAGVGVVVAGSPAVLTGVLIHDTKVDTDGRFGRGVDVDDDPPDIGFGTLLRGNGTLIGCHVADVFEVGVACANSDLTVIDTLVENTRHNEESQFADGVAAIAWPGRKATGTIQASCIRGNEGSGIAGYGATIDVESSSLECTGVPFVGEIHGGNEPHFTLPAGNVCGCDGESEECIVKKSADEGAPVDVPHKH